MAWTQSCNSWVKSYAGSCTPKGESSQQVLVLCSDLARTIHDLDASDVDISVQDPKPGGLLGIASIRRPSWVAFISRSRPELEITSSDRRYETGFASCVSAHNDLMNSPR